MKMTLLQKVRKKLLGFDKNDLLAKVNLLSQQVDDLTEVIKQVSPRESNAAIWLSDNKAERMDATNKLFDVNRRKFHLKRYEFAAKYVEGLNVADIACGTGYGTKTLKVLGDAREVLGVDLDVGAVEYARTKHDGEGILYMEGNAASIDVESSSFDVVVSFETIEHLPCEVDLLKEFYRLLKREGVLIISTPNNWPLTEFHLRKYDYNSFIEELGRYFKVEAIYNQNSGGHSVFNHQQEEGIVRTTKENKELAECFIAVCSK